ncbi:hypothetical protein P280DRAFT_231955 [Massarina eburnea CBS 473.64]|uniref:Uncharacterized protein n=1 Tax=Massarina eburnea CBS 473.64 TaxID=1395130 RepID=A0A6A6RHL2_9PLEO|nr:hypothetical protein P280DRAFT_231955 [Massarina eburnea CBS 473.64]
MATSNSFGLLSPDSPTPQPTSTNKNVSTSQSAPKVSALNQAPSKTIDKEKSDIRDLRTWNQKDRKWLLRDNVRVKIFQGSGPTAQVICQVSKYLFNVASNKAPELLVGRHRNEVHLPSDIDPMGVRLLIRELMRIVHHRSQAGRMTGTTTYNDLVMHCAAVMLGMEMYTHHNFMWHMAIFKNELISYEDIDAVCALPVCMDTPSTRIFDSVARTLAYNVRKDYIPDVDDFDAYLETNERLRDAITAANRKYLTWSKHEEHRARMREREAKQAEWEKKNEEWNARHGQVANQRKKEEAALWASKKAQEKKVGASMREKLRSNGKFDVEERRMYEKIFGKHPPKGH